MADKSKIEWTDATWNPLRGCSRVSPGCGGPNHQGGCYAEKIAARFSGPGQAFEGFAERTNQGGRWTGKVELVHAALDIPIRWRKPRRIFANSMSDLFHEELDVVDIAMIYGTAIAAVHLRKHIFQILTKRASHMRDVLADPIFWEVANDHAESLMLEHTDPLNRRSDDARATCEDYGPDKPPPGIWLGVSVEDQERADERIPHLLAAPAAVRFLSCEPLLGPVDLTAIRQTVAPGFFGDALEWHHRGKCHEDEGIVYPTVSWVIAGGESGRASRPMHPAWVRALRDQCQAAEVPFFFKQWGEWGPGATRASRPELCIYAGKLVADRTVFGDPAYLAVPAIEAATIQLMERVGKKNAGATLDGREWREMPV